MGARVLVIDDDSDTLQATSLLLELEGFVVHTARDGGRGLEAALALLPDLVLLDLNLPGLTGPEVLRKLREAPHASGVRVVVVSAALDEHLPSMDPRHYHATLAKPYGASELLKVLRGALPGAGRPN